jgi:hypothetical protein
MDVKHVQYYQYITLGKPFGQTNFLDNYNDINHW